MPFYKDAFEAPEGLVKRAVEDRQNLQRRETEDFLRKLCEAYEERSQRLWRRDYSSVEAYQRSVEPNRERWLRAIGDFSVYFAPEMEPKFEPFAETEKFTARWVTIKVFDGLNGRAILAVPKGKSGRLPVVICQHGISSSPERVFGLDDPRGIYHGFGRRLAEEGYIVLAPLNITFHKPRARLHRMCLLLGGTLFGLEVAKTRRFVDFLQTLPEADPERIGMWGMSLGGAYTMFTMPVEPRIKVGIVSAFFNHRVRKMVIDDPRYDCFLSSEEEHIFIPGWLVEFSDSDLLSLVCPRPLQIQAGKCDGIAWWPFLLEEFERLKGHYERLGVADRLELDLHEGGHEIDLERGLDFLVRWLHN